MSTHMTYAPPAAANANPVVSALWYAGTPAANYVETVDANATAYLAHGLYTGTLGTEPPLPPTRSEMPEAAVQDVESAATPAEPGSPSESPLSASGPVSENGGNFTEDASMQEGA